MLYFFQYCEERVHINIFRQYKELYCRAVVHEKNILCFYVGNNDPLLLCLSSE